MRDLSSARSRLRGPTNPITAITISIAAAMNARRPRGSQANLQLKAPEERANIG
jgi:hypothetical protein